jgi:o-succinylbenzoate---CoA ligase
MPGLRRLAMPRGNAVQSVLGDLAKALDGGEPLRPCPPEAADASGADHSDEWADDLPDDLAVVVGTSGSTGTVKLAMLTADNLVSSATATHDILGGPGRWLLALPGHHIAGLQVLVRSIVAGTLPCALDQEHGFTASPFVGATQDLHSSGAPRAYTSLVPTQLSRLLDDPAATEALASYDAVLVGGAALSTAERTRATDARVRVVSTYGLSETACRCQ